MKIFYQSLSIFALVFLAGCSKEPPAPPPPTPETAPVVLKEEINTLHKAEDLNQTVSDNTLEQRKKIDEATQ
jgi:hypothetical protein